ncbi:MAG: hypothetical protein EBR00_10555 [Gammaproteobacteria bacterium]|nr:hypothetical protein [Gammaproteobacteria bacterium]
MLGTAVEELWASSNLAFKLCPMLTQGAVEALEHYGSAAQKTLYLPKMVSGEWTGTMNLTEPQAGSDLAAIRTRAQPQGDHYRIFGQKIFITYGDHHAEHDPSGFGAHRRRTRWCQRDLDVRRTQSAGE